ncbi:MULTISPECIES: ribosome maturation factor RimM [Paenibacillus]|uniref:Ribosome maturation factor RimM n=1 Tax=Paenibacillus azoreducens TaxID=116718 RepID=A0A920CSE9_9BACL|nr:MULTISPECIES: ribosome maturation factor RimM [Paenibacillus]MBE9913782.1 ribosome maturation factor RimM [Paenibacillus donghaensis]GIO48069.1 ribosome maturation factor RimM [Paenibacillus azoreducens]
MPQTMLNVGKIVNTHGIRGEIKVLPHTDFPEVRFAKGSELLIVPEDGKAPLPVTVQSSRFHKNMYIVKLKEYDNINDVEKYKGSMLKVTQEDLVELPEDEYYFHQIIGCQVVTDEGQELGVITDILTPGANDVWVVQPKGGKSILIPYIDDVVLDVNVQDRKVLVHVMEGLL